MNEPSQESNCIVIDAPSPLYSLSVKDEELIETFSKRNFNVYTSALLVVFSMNQKIYWPSEFFRPHCNHLVHSQIAQLSSLPFTYYSNFQN